MKSLFEYILSYDAKKAAPRYGIVIRGIINPLVTATMKLINPYKLHIDKESCQPNDSTPKIFVANHGYREDIMNSLLTIKQPAYVLMGNVEMFMHSLDGFCMWLNGAILIDRNDKASRKASIEKMKHILLCERSVMIFPEATWNLSDNKLALELFGGFYDLAKITGAEVVPVTTYVAGKNCYSIMNDSINITEKSMQKENDILFYIERCM